MKKVRRHIGRLALLTLSLFVLQGVGLGFCAMPTPADKMTSTAHAMHGDDHAMPMTPCMTDEMPSSETSSCEHCSLFDTVGVIAAESTALDKAPLLAVLTPARSVNPVAAAQIVSDFSSLHGPPRSTSLIYSISLRILR